MSKDYIAEQFFAVDKLKYGKIARINKDDLYLQEKLQFRVFIYPVVFIASGFVIVKLFPKLLNKIKKELSIEEITLFPKPKAAQPPRAHLYNMESVNKFREELKNPKEREVVELYDSRKLSGRSIKYKPEYQTIINHNYGTMSEKTSNFINLKEDEPHKLKNCFEDINKTQKYLSRFLKLVLIGFPITLIVGSFLFDYAYTSFGLYLKYQPLVDCYYNNGKI